MEKDKTPDKRSPRHLSAEDAELWEKVTGTAKPLTRGKNRPRKLPDPPEPPANDATPSGAGRKRRAPKAGEPPARETPPPPAPPPLGAYDRGEVRALAGGKQAIEGRIDLHGMRQREAYAALKAFVQKSQARGHRHVLVITGKGGRVSEDGVARGVLNREVPRWLDEPEFRRAVVGFAPAHKRHGGEGALYVRLRRSRRA